MTGHSLTTGLPFGWYWAHGHEDDAESYHAASSREDAIAEAAEACDPGCWYTIAFARPETLDNHIFKFDGIADDFFEVNMEKTTEDGDLTGIATDEQAAELCSALAETLRAWREKYQIWRAWTLEFDATESFQKPDPSGDLVVGDGR